MNIVCKKTNNGGFNDMIDACVLSISEMRASVVESK